MPLQSCQSKGRKGTKFGKSGHCYTGRSQRSKASRQGRAIKSSQARRAK